MYVYGGCNNVHIICYLLYTFIFHRFLHTPATIQYRQRHSGWQIYFSLKIVSFAAQFKIDDDLKWLCIYIRAHARAPLVPANTYMYVSQYARIKLQLHEVTLLVQH